VESLVSYQRGGTVDQLELMRIKYQRTKLKERLPMKLGAIFEQIDYCGLSRAVDRIAESREATPRSSSSPGLLDRLLLTNNDGRIPSPEN
jgi:hypothetical protein